MSANPFAFMQPLIDLEDKINELRQLSNEGGMDMTAEITSLSDKFEGESRRLFDRLKAWERVQLARHPQRPQTTDYIDYLCTDYVPLAGDRSFADDEAIACGMGRIDDIGCMIIGQQKGTDVHERRRCNFGMPHPEGYRKAIAKMRIADKFGLPIVCLINTPGAFPGVEAEERGQSLAIAENIRDMFSLRVPIVCVIIGEGGSGGALGIGVGDRVLMLENSYYSVISPEGCAAILWKDGSRASDAAEQLKLTARELKDLGVVDEVILEPAGGAHRQAAETTRRVKEALTKHLRELLDVDEAGRRDSRYAKFRALGQILEK